MSRGLGKQQRRIMTILGEAGEGGLLPREIRQRSGSGNRSNIRKSVKRLQERGLVEKKKGERLHLTFAGSLMAGGLRTQNEPDSPLVDLRRRRKDWEELKRQIRRQREEERRHWLEEEERWAKPEPRYERHRYPSKNQLRVIAVLVRYAADPQKGLSASAVRRIAGIGDKSNARRAERALLERGTVQASKDGTRLRITPSSCSFLWRFAPSMIDPPLDDEEAEAVLRVYGEWSRVVA